MNKLKEKIPEWLGLNKQSDYVNNYFYMTNMRASIYMAIVVTVLEVWMIIRMTLLLMGMSELSRPVSYYIQKYYINYFILLACGIGMLICAIRALTNKAAGQNAGKIMLWIFSVVCIYFGVSISLSDYSKGEQILTFLTMELFVVCLITWRPIVGFAILTASYGYICWCMSGMKDPVSGNPGISVATQINMFTMWVASLMFCISNYNKVISQATKDENLEKANSNLQRVVTYDDMTGIHNMHYFRDEAPRLLVEKGASNMIFLFFDIENFKSYNEKYGFQAGNDLLIRFAKRIEQAFEGSLVSRFSDDHFVVLTGRGGYMDIITTLAAKLRTMQSEVHIELKCGAYEPSSNDMDVSAACDMARFASGSIKKHYGTPFRLYDKSLEDQFIMKKYIVNSIDNAIAKGYIKVYYQPVISAADGSICGLEALARWIDPVYGFMPPGAFIGILEEYRQIHKLDLCIAEEVCSDLHIAADEGYPVVPVSLNFSRLDFELCDIVGELCRLADKYNVPRNLLDVEVTESALNDNQDFLRDNMDRLRSEGFNIWLDDFGSGYSSLNVLKDYQFDVLKIDMKFLFGFGTNAKTKPILNNVVSLTKQLSMVSLTEGVETQEQYEFLRSIGCDKLQGYLFSKPVPLEQLMDRVRKGDFRMAGTVLK